MEHLANWMGIKIRVITCSIHTDWNQELSQATKHGQVCVAVSADTLVQIPKLSEITRAISEFGVEGGMPMLVYGLGSASSHTALLESLECRSINGVHRIQKQPLCYRFSIDEKACLQQLAGLEFCDEARIACDVFQLAPLCMGEVDPLLLAEDRPVFVRTHGGRGNIDLYLWATDQIADVGAPLSQGIGFESMYQWLLPAIIFLKSCFGQRCWHNPNVRARLIIDDPLLHPQYGFLRYDALVRSMNRVPYGTSLAFIPWNYRRSQKQVAELFQANRDRLSLCVHGCDHTNHEFDSDDEQHLTRLASLALRRMTVHHERSGLLHEQIMVFPQGHFSSIALRALRNNGFVAAVNSSCFPSRGEAEIPLGELMRPAVCRFHGFPIFLRRYPNRIIDTAVDLWIGRAGLVVEHHEFLRDGYRKWEQFASQVNALDGRLSWGPLIETVMGACLQKLADDNAIDIRLFTRVFRWTNQLEYSVLVHLSKFEPDSTRIKEVRVDGRIRSFRIVEGYLECDVVVEGKSSIIVEILDQESYAGLPFKPSMSHQIAVGTRRLLSEFRDNSLGRYPLLHEYARGLARYLKLTGDSG